MLPNTALTHLQNLLGERFSASAGILDTAIQSFNRKEMDGRGQGYAARLAAIYAMQLKPVGADISEVLRDVHARFDLGLSEEVKQEILSLADTTLQTWVSGMEGAYARHLGRCGVSAPPLNWGLTVKSSRAGLATSLHKYFWNLENLPPMPKESHHIVNNFNAPVNVVQTGSKSIAHVHAAWAPSDILDAVDALTQFRAALQRDAGIPSEVRAELENEIICVAQELQESSPSSARLTRWLGGIGTTIQTIGSLQSAWQVVLPALKALGL